MKPPRTTFVYLILRRLLKLNATKVLLASVFLWLTEYEFCRLRYGRDPHSAFFDGRDTYEWKYSLYREHEARRLIAGHNAPSDPHASVGSLLEGLDPRERSALCLNILFADTDPSRNPSWGQKWTDRLADKTGSYDIPIADGWMVKTLKALSDISHKSTQNPWIYLRLVYTETSMSWSLSDFAYRGMTFIFLIVQLAVFAGLMLLLRLTSSHPYLDYPTIGVICLISVPSFLGLTYTIGKYSLMPLKEVVDELITFLKDMKAGQTDLMIEEYADMARLTRYALAPQQFQHVGLKSSRDNLAINTRSTWAFWFEQNGPTKLKREHEELLQHAVVQLMLGHA
ncbi:hypothetical protein BDV24DRAFT_149437 [Aspergillus arachidicola]|uniref:Integral membrane protein n=1 Tax=Aspergillus arachidicola TaxID=656916 RepID=A0A5N6YK21_9EURO|nr:hypothetical protein BDV24DRAFT_149437 [Aspergillus arachidicola]